MGNVGLALDGVDTREVLGRFRLEGVLLTTVHPEAGNCHEEYVSMGVERGKSIGGAEKQEGRDVQERGRETEVRASVRSLRSSGAQSNANREHDHCHKQR